MPIEVEITNNGEGRSGVINVWCSAYDRTNPSLCVSDFNTSELVDINGVVSNTIQPKGHPGSIVRATGNLILPPGDYDVRLKIYEDAGKRTLVYGHAAVIVDDKMVATPQPYVPEGGERGRGYEKSEGGVPGFGGVEALAVAGVALLAFALRRVH